MTTALIILTTLNIVATITVAAVLRRQVKSTQQSADDWGHALGKQLLHVRQTLSMPFLSDKD